MAISDEPSHGALIFWSNTIEHTCRFQLEPREEHTFGREDVGKMLGIVFPTLSKRHLYIRCILFEEETAPHIPLLIYAQDLGSRNGTYIEGAGGKPRPLGSAPRLLCHGDTLELTPSLFVTVDLDSSSSEEKAFTPVQEDEIKMFESMYSVTPRKVGSGAQGSVFLALEAETQRQLACKVIGLKPAGPTTSAAFHKQKTLLKNEISKYNREHEILKDLSHPNIISIEQVFFTTETIYIISELYTGGDLFSYLESRQETGVNLGEAAVMIRQILEAVAYLHDHGVTHRDIKPDNVLMTSWRPGARVVLTDFGHASRTPESLVSRRMHSAVGTYDFSAPEQRIRQHGGYSGAVDLWAVGCTAAMLLTGAVDAPNKENSEAWKHVAKRPRDFVESLLVVDEMERLTAKQALAHSWLAHPSYAAEFEAVYDRAIRSWKPCLPSQDEFVKYIGSS